MRACRILSCTDDDPSESHEVTEKIALELCVSVQKSGRRRPPMFDYIDYTAVDRALASNEYVGPCPTLEPYFNPRWQFARHVLPQPASISMSLVILTKLAGRVTLSW